jgi:cytochrome c553
MPNYRPVCAAAILLLASTSSGCATSGAGPSPEPAHAPPPNTAEGRGAWVFSVAGCTLCHGRTGQGGVKNRNSETGGKINGLTLVKESYSAKELAQKIREGVREVGRENPHGPAPPLRMPAYGKWIPDQAISDVVAYLFSLYPKGKAKEDSWDDDSSDGEDTGPSQDTKGSSVKPAKPGDGAKPEGSSEGDDDEADHPARERKLTP